MMLDQKGIGQSVDIYDEIEPPKYWIMIGMILTVVTFCIAARFVDNSMPFFAALASGVLWLLISVTWHLRHRTLLWLQLTIVAVLHAIFLAVIPWPENVSFGLLFTPLVALDALGCHKIIIYTLKKYDQKLHSKG